MPLRDSPEHNGGVVRVLADALRRGAALPGLLSHSDAALALLMRQHFCVNLDCDRQLLNDDDVVSSDRLARIAHVCLTQAVPPDLYADHFGFRAYLQTLQAEMADAVQARSYR